jgi:DNA repair exonuclease SbcCD ATPase subunit
MRKQTKADKILNDSVMRLEAARIRERTAQSQLNTAKALREYAEEAHEALEKELAPTPRKASKKPAASPPAQKEELSDKEPICGVCGNAQEHPDHAKTYLSSHDFEGPKSVARVGRKSKQKSEAPASGQSSETGTDAAMAASNIGD